MSRRERRAQHSSSAPWPARLALFGVIAIFVVGSVVARLLLVPYVVDGVSRLAHGSSAWMFAAGWATVGFAPAAVLVFLLDGNRRERQLGDDPRDRPRAGHGHAVAGLGIGYWVRRLPLILILVVAVVFAPSRGGNPVGSDPFRHGWHLTLLISLPTLMALLVFRLMALLPGHGDRLLRTAGPFTAAAPGLALLGLFAPGH